MARKSTQTTRPIKPVPLSIPGFTVDETDAVQALVKIYVWARKSQNGAASNAQPAAQHHREKRAAGKQKAKENQPADEEPSRVASGSAPSAQRPIKKARTFLSVEPSDRVLRSRQPASALRPPALVPPPSGATEDTDEERPRKRARTVAS